MYETDDVTITTVTSILVITSIVGNSLVCAVIIRHRDMSRHVLDINLALFYVVHVIHGLLKFGEYCSIPVNFLLANLAIADIMYALFYIPRIIWGHIASHPEGLAGRILCALLTDAALAWVGGASSVFTLVAVATERYYSVLHPLENKAHLSVRKLKISQCPVLLFFTSLALSNFIYGLPIFISGSWILALIMNVPEFWKKIEGSTCSYAWTKKWMPKAYTLIWRVFFGLSFMLMTGLYSRVIYALWFKNASNSKVVNRQKGGVKVRKRVTLMVVAVTAIFGICWGADSVLHVLKYFSSNKLASSAIPIAHTAVMFNSAVNPFAYALINQRFRKKMKRILFIGNHGCSRQ
ncbi:unnamed protein product [Porites lobata]|uniref:G-protein coupled receptors family 1 profile domain-containing protein n=1 Tax=Porites lobata TaxID=104759 RepID=A0ABN8R4Z9_9CNID|nr:unnamed protein product [Porites lobata]